MTNYKVTGITSFVPSLDYDLSCRFYKEMGFIETAVIENATRFDIDNFGFWLQNYYVKDLADNFMLCLYVEDLNAWASRINEVDFANDYDNKARVLSQPHEQEGALMMQFTDPSGVLWHVRQSD
jgi:hypothetical protein